MSVRTRGLIVFGVIIFVAVVFCGIIPFAVMPGNGIGIALPVIEVPGEVVVEDFLPGFNLTNTIIGTVLADIVVLIFVFLAWRASKGWTNEVPGRMQALAETIIEGIYGFFEGLAGERLRKAPFLWPLVATIFIFLLAANWMKLLPGVETVGKMHCAHVGKSGYAMLPGWTDNSYRLWVDAPLDAGTTQTEEGEHACEAYFTEHAYERFSVEDAESIEAQVVAYDLVLEEVHAQFPQLEAAEAEGDHGEAVTETAEATATPEDAEAVASTETEAADDHSEEAAAEPAVAEEELEAAYEAALAALAAAGEPVSVIEGSTYAEAVAYTEFAETRLRSAQVLAFVEPVLANLEAAAGETEEATPREAIREEIVEAANDSQEMTTSEDLRSEMVSAMAALEAAEDEEATTAVLEELESTLVEVRNHALTQIQYPGATLTFNEDQLESGAVPFIFHITPFVRGAATDLSLTFALAIMAVVIVQAYGVWALGPAYFEKFINISALGNLGKRPLGAIDFVVGLIEIISEIGKIISLAFRLFGNLFAGGVALMAVSFLVALLIPGVIISLEIIIGAVQALVFAVLTLVFSVQAMEHHGDHEEEQH